MLDAGPAPAFAAGPSTSGGAGGASPAPRGGGGIDTTRVLNLFGYVGPVASLMTHTLFPSPARGGGGGGGGGIGLQRMPSFTSGGSGSLRSRPSTGLTPGKTRFVLSRTEDAMDSVLPCAAERVFKRPGRFANASGMRFSYGNGQQ